MSKAKQANVPPIYPLKGEHKKPEHAKPEEIKGKTDGEQEAHEQFEKTNNVEPINNTEPVEMHEMEEIPNVHEQPTSLQYEMDIYQSPVIDKQVRRPNLLLEPSSYPQVMSKQLSKYEGMLKPQPIEIELRGRLPSYEVDKAIEKYPFTMDISSIEELKEKKRKFFHKIPENSVFRKHIPKQVELDKFIDALKDKVIHDYNIPISVKDLRAEYKRCPCFRDIVKYNRTGYCSYVGKSQRLFNMLC